MRVLITGANRGLGNAITKQLLQAGIPLTLHVTARDLNSFDLSKYEATTSTIVYHKLHIDDENPANISAFTSSLPSFNHIFHIASPYNKTNLQQGTQADLNTITTCQRNELLLLSQLSRKLIDGGSLVAAGSIVGVVSDHANSLPNHPWYAGLFSLYKANLRSIMACLYQEMPNHRIIHANLGAFLDESETDNELLKSGHVFTTQSVAKTMIDLATSKSATINFNVDIISNFELQTLHQVMACK